jgi:hypothetical protein
MSYGRDAFLHRLSLGHTTRRRLGPCGGLTVSLFKRTPPPEVPWCVVAKMAFGQLRTMKVHEVAAPMLVREYGWSVLIRDTEMPADAHIHWAPQMNPLREDDGA